jgi:hypothetical protein
MNGHAFTTRNLTSDPQGQLVAYCILGQLEQKNELFEEE